MGRVGESEGGERVPETGCCAGESSVTKCFKTG